MGVRDFFGLNPGASNRPREEPRPEPELLEDGSILAPVPGDDGYTTVKLSPGEPEHAEWLALIQKGRATPTSGGGFAFWNGEAFVGFGTLGLVILAVLFFSKSGPFEEEACIITTVGGNTLCGDDARNWCAASDDLRALDPANARESQRLCDDLGD